MYQEKKFLAIEQKAWFSRLKGKNVQNHSTVTYMLTFAKRRRENVAFAYNP